MGGTNEKVIETARQGETTIGKIRIHESAGEVHFHDGVANLKVAVPAGKFWGAWSGNARLKPITFYDSNRGTCAGIKFHTDPTSAKVSAAIHISKVELDPTFRQLNDFAMGR